MRRRRFFGGSGATDDTVLSEELVAPATAGASTAWPGIVRGHPRLHRAPPNALAYAWKHFIGGHLGRLGTRDDVTLHQQCMADISASVRTAIDTLDPTPYYQRYGENTRAAAKAHLDATAATAAAPVIEKYTGVLAAADVFTESTTFWVMESIRLDLGYGSRVHH